MPLLALLIVAAVAAACVFLLTLRYPRSPLPTIAAARTVGRSLGRRERMGHVLRGRLDPAAATGLALTLALLLAMGGGILLALLAYLVRSNDALARVDNSVARWGDAHASSLSTDGLQIVTTLGETWFVLVAAIVVAIVESVRVPSRWIVPFLAVVILGNNLLTHTVKELADRVRPDLNPIAATLGPSFPSGHSSTAAAFFAAAALVLGRRRGHLARALLAAGAVAIAVGVACTRVLLDVHWLSDVVAGVTLGWAWFALCATAFGGRLLRFGATAEVAVGAAEAVAPTNESPRLGTPPAR